MQCLQCLHCHVVLSILCLSTKNTNTNFLQFFFSFSSRNNDVILLCLTSDDDENGENIIFFTLDLFATEKRPDNKWIWTVLKVWEFERYTQCFSVLMNFWLCFVFHHIFPFLWFFGAILSRWAHWNLKNLYHEVLFDIALNLQWKFFTTSLFLMLVLFFANISFFQYIFSIFSIDRTLFFPN